MRQDIHAYLETLNDRYDGSSFWWTTADMRLSRDRHMQWLMAWTDGAMNGRGFPADMCEFTERAFEPEYGHYGASWLTLAEMEEVMREYEYGVDGEEGIGAPPGLDWLALLAMMRVYGERCRLVFWFSY